MAPNNLTAQTVEMTTVEDLHHSDTSSASDMSSTQPEFDANFNAPIVQSWKQKAFDRTFVVLAQSAQLMYLLWRWQRFCTVKSTLIFSLPFILSETFIVLGGAFITYFMVWNQIDRPKLRLVDMKIDRKQLPSVDVMIPCYNEPVEVRARPYSPLTPDGDRCA